LEHASRKKSVLRRLPLTLVPLSWRKNVLEFDARLKLNSSGSGAKISHRQ
jgi:hypothetical protein